MKISYKFIVLVVILGVSSSTALAGHRHHNREHVNKHINFAKVIHVETIYQWVSTPHRRKICREEMVQYDGHRSNPGAVLAGGVIGGMIGNKLGRRHGDRHAATLVGTIIGAAVGHGVSRHRTGKRIDVERRCRRVTEYTKKRHITGYRVEYRYRGHYYQTHMDHHPGRKIRVNARMVPANY